jgi:hypothetical protein
MIFAEVETGRGERRGTGAGGPPPGIPPLRRLTGQLTIAARVAMVVD